MISEEPTIVVDQDGVSVREMDPSHVAMCDFRLGKEYLDDFDCLNPPIKIALDLGNALKYFKSVRKDDYVRLAWDACDSKLRITFAGQNARTFTVKTLEPTETKEDPPVPKLTLDAKVRLLTKALTHALSDLELLNDHAEISVDERIVRLTASNEGDQCDYAMERGDERLIDVRASTQAKAIYSIAWLKEFAKALSQLSEVITLELSNNMPIRVSVDLSGAQMHYWLAPRIAEE